MPNQLSHRESRHIQNNIAELSWELANLINALDLPLSQSQHRYVLLIADGLITAHGSKILSALYRPIVDELCPKSAADTFRASPWQANESCVPLREELVKSAFELAQVQGQPKRAFLSLDDSLTAQDNGSNAHSL